MSLSAALSIATSSLANVNSQLALVSHNIANADTPGYVTETATQEDLTSNGIGIGVIAGPVTRNVDASLQAQVFQQNATVAGLQTTQTALQAIDAVQGTPGQGGDVASLLGQLQDQFSTLLNDPSNQTQQAAVVSAAGTLATTINALSSTYTQQRQTAENNIVSEVNTINGALGTISQLNAQIVTLRSGGGDTADLENQRDQAVQQLEQLVDVNTLVQSDGNMLITTTGGVALPTDGTANPLSTTGANVPPGTYYPGGGIPAITLDGADITGQLTGGQLGANITLRDTTLPTYQAELDEFSQNLASRFSAQGLTLFSDPTGNVPAGGGVPAQQGYVGFAAEIQVNPAVQADPSLVRDGTDTIAGSATGAAAFTPNPPGGPAGFSTLINNVLTYTFGADVQDGVTQPASNTTGLGASGTLDAPYTPPATLGGIASALVASEAQDSANTTSQLTTEQAVQTTLSNSLSTGSGVNLDNEMSLMIQLQNAYGVNARIIGAVQSMMTQLHQRGAGMTGAPWHFEAEKKRTPPPLEGLGRKADQGRGGVRTAADSGSTHPSAWPWSALRPKPSRGGDVFSFFFYPSVPAMSISAATPADYWHDDQPDQRHRFDQDKAGSAHHADQHRPGLQHLCRPRCRRRGVARPQSPDRHPADLAEQHQRRHRHHGGVADGDDADPADRLRLPGADQQPGRRRLVRGRYHRRLRATGAGAGG